DHAQLPSALGLVGTRIRPRAGAAARRLAGEARSALDRDRGRIAGLRPLLPARNRQMNDELHAYALLVLVGFLPNEIWRMRGLVVGRGIDEDSGLSYGRGLSRLRCSRASSPRSSCFRPER